MKVYVVEVGAYSDRYIDVIFTTRELAEAYILAHQRADFEKNGRKPGRVITSWHFDVGDVPTTHDLVYHGDGRITRNGEVIGHGTPSGDEVPGETFEEFVKRHTWNEYGDIEEYDVWDVLPVLEEA